MSTVAPITYIELTKGRQGQTQPVIAGTRIRVHDIAVMYVWNNSSLEWIVENYDLTPAQIYAALSYYYDHQDQIDSEIRAADEQVRAVAQTLDELKAEINGRHVEE